MSEFAKLMRRKLAAARNHQRRSAGVWGVAALTVCGCVTGCAVHYRNPRTGHEHLFGLGQMRLATDSANTNWIAVTSGIRVPGLCLSVGRDHFGLTLGYLTQQRLAVISSAELPALISPTNSPALRLASGPDSIWALGHLRMRDAGSSRRHWAVVTGRALAGLGAGAGGGDTRFSLALDSRQAAVVQHENIQLELDQDAPLWPGFDLFGTTVSASEGINQPTKE